MELSAPKGKLARTSFVVVAMLGMSAIGCDYGMDLDSEELDRSAVEIEASSAGYRLQRTIANPTRAEADRFGIPAAAMGQNVLIGGLNTNAVYLFDPTPESSFTPSRTPTPISSRTLASVLEQRPWATMSSWATRV
jgi:hypothetical protein